MATWSAAEPEDVAKRWGNGYVAAEFLGEGGGLRAFPVEEGVLVDHRGEAGELGAPQRRGRGRGSSTMGMAGGREFEGES